MIKVTVIIILLIIAMMCYISNSVLLFRFDISIFSRFNEVFWNPQISWVNKYKYDSLGKRTSKFFLSTTVLVWTTDAYHLLQFIYLSCIQLSMAILLNNYIVVIDNKIINCIFIFISIKSTFSFTFEKMFSKLLIKKTKV